MPAYQRPRGTQDVLPEATAKWRRLEALIAGHSASFGYGEIRTPIFEESDLYTRTSGASSDIVRKEMYTFKDRGGRLLTLRPEGTAGVGRAYLENGLPSAPQPVKLWYLGPMFRYDRPQAGRFRQHTQYGIEVFGAASPLADVEVILVAHELFAAAGLTRLVIRLNSIGCPACRPVYRAKLVSYFEGRVGDLCEDCQDRFRQNPLRLFDCKNERCRALLLGAPMSADNLCPECQSHFARVKEGLGSLGLRYTDDPGLVRGLDYYSRTVFEIVYDPAGTGGNEAGGAAKDEAGGGSHRVLCGGGRYDGLVEELGGAPTPGVGFGLGVERLLATLEAEGLEAAAEGGTTGLSAGVVHVATVGAAAEIAGFDLARRLRRAGFVAICDLLGRSLRSQFKASHRAGARWMLIIGDEELAAGVVAVRDLASGKQTSVPADEVLAELGRGAQS